MKVLRTPGRGMGQRLVFEEAEFDAIALDALRKVQLLPAHPEPVRIDRFVEKYFELTVGYLDLGPAVLGATLFEADGSVAAIMVAAELDAERAANLLRSTLAHEAGHGLLHPILFMRDPGQSGFALDNTDSAGRRILCRASDIRPGASRSYGGRWWEYQANRMIGSLLLPRPRVLEVCAEFVNRTAITGNPSVPAERRPAAIAAIAATFQVSSLSAGIRLDELYPPNSGQTEF